MPAAQLVFMAKSTIGCPLPLPAGRNSILLSCPPISISVRTAGASRFNTVKDKWDIYTEQNAPMEEIWNYNVCYRDGKVHLAVTMDGDSVGTAALQVNDEVAQRYVGQQRYDGFGGLLRFHACNQVEHVRDRAPHLGAEVGGADDQRVRHRGALGGEKGPRGQHGGSPHWGVGVGHEPPEQGGRFIRPGLGR